MRLSFKRFRERRSPLPSILQIHTLHGNRFPRRRRCDVAAGGACPLNNAASPNTGRKYFLLPTIPLPKICWIHLLPHARWSKHICRNSPLCTRPRWCLRSYSARITIPVPLSAPIFGRNLRGIGRRIRYQLHRLGTHEAPTDLLTRTLLQALSACAPPSSVPIEQLF